MFRVVIILSLLIVALGATFMVARRAVRQDLVPGVVKFQPLYDVPSFELLDQNGKTITHRDLAGSVWIADFVFTNCAGPCPVMSTKLAEVQQRVPRKDVKLVSFTVDPERDTPAVLKEYARRYDADESRWSFLTGKTEAIYEVARGMKIAAQPASGDQPILHSDVFLLVNRAGQVVGIYHNKGPDEVARLSADATELAATK